FAFADVGGLHLPASMKYVVSNVAAEVDGKSVVFSIDDFIVNGAKVPLPKSAIHENVVSPEAQALMTKYEQLVYRAAAHGLVTASGRVAHEVETSPMRYRFTFSAPRFVLVSLLSQKPGT